MLASAELETAGHGAAHHVHPDGADVLIDVRTGAHLGTFDAHTPDAYGVIPAGEGAWLTFDDGVFHRHTR
ncbi:hypothetical protein [Lentzea sp. CA-135723]|uniref:hypothetical protein n=1 Tax=Lentzea sp. CA-135723 TaxID=3239950 RepID=UPI003D9105DF